MYNASEEWEVTEAEVMLGQIWKENELLHTGKSVKQNMTINSPPFVTNCKMEMPDVLIVTPVRSNAI